MQRLLGFFLFTVTLVASVPIEYYASRYEHIDIETALSNKRLIQNYGDCLLFKKPCAPQGKELRDILPEALETTCSRCSEKQIIYAMRVVHRLQKEYPDLWKQLSDRWDPTGKYLRTFEELFNSPNKIERSPSPPTTTEDIPLFNRFNNANEISPNDISSTGDLDNIDQSNFPSSTSISSVNTTAPTAAAGISSTTTQVRTTTSISTARPQLFLNRQSHWLDVLGSQVLQTAGKIADMFVSTVEVVVGAKYRRHAAYNAAVTTKA